MGCQGEIYNVYGIVVDAEFHCRGQGNSAGWDNPVVYKVNGKLVSPDEDGAEELLESRNEVLDHHALIPTRGVDLENPELVTRIIGHDREMGSRHFKKKALIGYVVANESYINGVSEVAEGYEKLSTRLIKDIKEDYGIAVKKKDLKLHLVFDSLNGY